MILCLSIWPSVCLCMCLSVYHTLRWLLVGAEATSHNGKSGQVNFHPGELILKLLTRIDEWYENLSEYTRFSGPCTYGETNWPVLAAAFIKPRLNTSFSRGRMWKFLAPPVTEMSRFGRSSFQWFIISLSACLTGVWSSSLTYWFRRNKDWCEWRHNTIRIQTSQYVYFRPLPKDGERYRFQFVSSHPGRGGGTYLGWPGKGATYSRCVPPYLPARVGTPSHGQSRYPLSKVGTPPPA